MRLTVTMTRSAKGVSTKPKTHCGTPNGIMENTAAKPSRGAVNWKKHEKSAVTIVTTIVTTITTTITTVTRLFVSSLRNQGQVPSESGPSSNRAILDQWHQ